MRFSSLSASERRTVTMGGAVVAVSLLYLWGVRPYKNALSSAREQLDAERSALARERAAVADARRNPRLQHVADSAMRVMEPRLFEGRDDVMASAELASYVGETSNRDRVWLQDAATRPATRAPSGVRTFRVEIRGESDLHGLLTLLRSLEHGPKLVRVDRLDVSRSQRSDVSDMETLSISAGISGFGLSEASGTGAAPTVTAAQRPTGAQR